MPFATGPGFARMSEAAYVKAIRLHRFGEDFAVEGYLRDPYGESLRVAPASRRLSGGHPAHPG